MTEYKATVVWSSGASVRMNPNTSGNPLATLPSGFQFVIDQLVPDSVDPTNPQKLWGRISGSSYAGKYVALLYPSSSANSTRCTWEEVVAPPPTNEVIRTHVIEVYSDGSVVIDGKPV